MRNDGLVKTVFDWEHFVIYLSGAIDFGRELAAGWREDLTQRLVEIGFKPNQIFNPCKKPLGDAQFNLDNESEIMDKHRSRREWKDLMNMMSQIAHIDLRMVDKADLVLVYFPKYGQELFSGVVEKFMTSYQTLTGNSDPYRLPYCHEQRMALDSMFEAFGELLAASADHRIPTYGTLHEIVIAHGEHKPIYVVWEGGKDTCSAWLMYLVGHRNIFGTFDELITRLDNISKGRTAYSAREWLLLDMTERDLETEKLEESAKAEQSLV